MTHEKTPLSRRPDKVNILDPRPWNSNAAEMLDDVPPVVQPLVTAVRSGGDLKSAMTALLQEFEFDQFAFSRRNLRGNNLGSRFASWGQRREGWFDCVHQRRYAAVDPIRCSVLQSPTPVSWDIRFAARDVAARPFLYDAESFGMSSGISMIIFRPDAAHVDFFSVTSPVRVISDARSRHLQQRMQDLWALGAYCHALLPESAIELRGTWSYSRPSLLAINSRRMVHLASIIDRRGNR